jgi:hypothetical protein
VFSLIVFRSLPFVGYLLGTPAVEGRTRLGWACAVGVGVFCVHAVAPDAVVDLEYAVLLYGYFFIAALIVHRFGGLLPAPFIRGGGLLLVSLLALVVAPAVLVHAPAVVAMVVVGWELTLSAHSYAVDTIEASRRATLGEGLFFLLVNPTLAYRERGFREGPPRLRWRALLRLGAGSLTIFGRDIVLVTTAAVPALRPFDLTEIRDAAGYGRFCGTQLLMGLGLYCAHSGLASVQIGWMLLLGHRVPERYRRPFLATSPQDFWHRWNTWVGRWAHCYLFVPVGHPAARRWGSLGSTGALVFAFVGVGLLHDVGFWALNLGHGRGWSLRFSAVFALCALLILVWRWAARLGRQLLGEPSRGSAFTRECFAWAACSQFVCLLCWVVIPVLRGSRLPPLLERWLPTWVGGP